MSQLKKCRTKLPRNPRTHVRAYNLPHLYMPSLGAPGICFVCGRRASQPRESCVDTTAGL